jgi:biotin carboxylase
MPDHATQPAVLILGGGADQTLLVQEFARRGWRTIVMDYYPNPPAKRLADLHVQASCYDRDAALALAREHHVRRVTTICTDQPLLVAATVSEELGLPTLVSSQTALALTNKAQMKTVMTAHAIPTARHCVVTSADDPAHACAALALPLIVKPADSSGSRGVQVVRAAAALPAAVTAARVFSRCDRVIIEAYLTGYEVSVDAFVQDGRAQVLMCSDNYKVQQPGKTALAARSQYPSRMSAALHQRVRDIMQQLATAFGLVTTPLFAQVLVCDEHIFVVELSARLAGGSKPLFIKTVTGVDVVGAFVAQLLGAPCIFHARSSADIVSVQYVYCQPGVIQSLRGFDALLADGQLAAYVPYRAPGDTVRGWAHGGDRVAAYFLRGATLADIRAADARVAQATAVIDNRGNDLMIRGLHFP